MVSAIDSSATAEKDRNFDTLENRFLQSQFPFSLVSIGLNKTWFTWLYEFLAYTTNSRNRVDEPLETLTCMETNNADSFHKNERRAEVNYMPILALLQTSVAFKILILTQKFLGFDNTTGTIMTCLSWLYFEQKLSSRKLLKTKDEDQKSANSLHGRENKRSLTLETCVYSVSAVLILSWYRVNTLLVLAIKELQCFLYHT